VDYDGRLYSVPHALVGEGVEVRATESTIEILHKGARVVSYRRNWGPKGSATTLEEHRPKSHREYGAWPPSRIQSWAASLGPAVGELVIAIMESKPHPEMGYRSCMALIRDTKQYSAERVDAACRRALEIGSPTRKTVQMILKRGLERMPLAQPLPCTLVDHDNVRGGAYYDRKETES
jgi:transposase